MTKDSFTSKTYIFKLLSAFFAIGSILFPFVSKIGWGTYPFVILCIAMAFFFWRVPPQKIEVDESGIRKIHYDSSSTGLMTRFVQPNAEFEWSRIHSVSTKRLSSGALLTIISTVKDTHNKPENRMTISSSFFKDYVTILKKIKAGASQARFDETTEAILHDQVII